MAAAVWGWRTQLPLSVAMVRGVLATAVPVLSLTVIAVCVSAVQTARAYGEITARYQAISRNPGPEYARLADRHWPE